MQEREIPRLYVERTLAKPDRVYLGAQGNPIAERVFRSGTIRVVFLDRTDATGMHRHVITVMWK
jgi:hypothetical protein